MKKKSIIIVFFLLFTILTGSYAVSAKTSDEIIFKDCNLQNALSQFYDKKTSFTKKNAIELSKTKHNAIVLNDAKISDLEGLQYFENLITIYLSGNNLKNLKPLSSLKKLEMLVILNNATQGKSLQNYLISMGKIEKLDTLELSNNRLTDIGFLDNIGSINSYNWIDLENNNVKDISILEKATDLDTLNLSNNRITDVSPLKNLKNLDYWLDLKDNCIIDYKPIKPILDKIYEDGGWDGVVSRYDYYTNPVDVGVNGKTVKFPYLTVYYKYQAYVEAIPLFKALGGSAIYDKKTGTLTCKYDGNVLIIKDFSKSYTLNGKKKSLSYPMRRMQYDLAYVPVKDICKALGLNCSVTKKRKLSEKEDEYFYAPKYIEISKTEAELG